MCVTALSSCLKMSLDFLLFSFCHLQYSCTYDRECNTKCSLIVSLNPLNTFILTHGQMTEPKPKPMQQLFVYTLFSQPTVQSRKKFYKTVTVIKSLSRHICQTNPAVLKLFSLLICFECYV